MPTLEQTAHFIRTLVRPLITVGIVAGFVVAAFTSPEAADKLESLAGIVMAWWFSDRSAQNAAPPVNG
jgi:pheromone shutdown protein TraB